MIKSLRRKFVFINIALVFTVLTMVFTSIAVINMRRIRGGASAALEMALGERKAGKYFITVTPRNGFGTPPHPELIMHLAAFSVSVSESGEVEFVSMPEQSDYNYAESIDEIAQSALSQSRIIAESLPDGHGHMAEGILPEYGLRFMLRQDESETRISFLELSYEKTAVRSAVLMSVFGEVLSLSAFFLISVFLSKWALKPVEKAWEAQKRFISDASHELKTPITVILANMRILQSDPAGAERMKWINNTKEEAAGMKELIDGLLFLAKSDDGEQAKIFEEVNLSDIVVNMALFMESVAYEKGVLIDIDRIESNISVTGDREQLKSLVTIILDNAVKYSAEGTEISIKLSSEKGKSALCITNKGAYLPPEKIPFIFDRFYRADESRNSEGYGLGLSLAKSIVNRHGGTISAYSDNGITTFNILLPLSC